MTCRIASQSLPSRSGPFSFLHMYVCTSHTVLRLHVGHSITPTFCVTSLKHALPKPKQTLALTRENALSASPNHTPIIPIPPIDFQPSSKCEMPSFPFPTSKKKRGGLGRFKVSQSEERQEKGILRLRIKRVEHHRDEIDGGFGCVLSPRAELCLYHSREQWNGENMYFCERYGRSFALRRN